MGSSWFGAKNGVVNLYACFCDDIQGFDMIYKYFAVFFSENLRI